MSRRPGIGANGIKIINSAIRSMSPEELNGLLLEATAKRFVARTLSKLRSGKHFFSIHRYIKDRLIQIELEKDNEQK